MLHADPVAQQRAAGEWARGVDADHGDGVALRAIHLDEAFGERALAGARRARDADASRPPDVAMDATEEGLEAGSCVLDYGDGARERGHVSVEQVRQKRVG